MKVLNFEYMLTEDITLKKLLEVNQYLLPEIAALNEAINSGYKTKYAFINLSDDKDIINKTIHLKTQILKLDPKVLIVIGIGGSSLGAMAVIEALKGRLYNSFENKIELYFLETIDDDYYSNLSKYIENLLRNNQNIVINIVTKSGTTLETISNASLLLELLKKYKKDYQNYVYVTTDFDSPIYNIAKQNNWGICEIPKLVGGRFSVLSSVSLLPLAISGIDIAQLLSGASSIKQLCLSDDIENNPASLGAAIVYLYYLDKKNIYELFMFSPDFLSLGLWFRQLIAESLGKRFSTSGRYIEVGITPAFSIATQDLHSMLQLYLAGPRDKFFSFLSIEGENERVVIPNNEISQIMDYVQNKSLTNIKRSIFSSIKDSFNENNKPFVSIILKEKNAYYLGQFLMLKMIETVYLARLLDVNPFDQPDVEAYKSRAKEILSDKI